MGQITLHWLEEHLMVCSDSNNHSVVVGRNGQNWVGLKPAEMLLMAAASCATWDVTEILLKQREPLLDFKVICSGDQSSDPPYNFTKIHLHYIVRGAVNPQKLERAIQLSEDKYCSVISTLRPGVPVTSDYELVAEVPSPA